MGKEVFDDSQFLENVKEICVNNPINKIWGDDLKEFIEKVKTILVNHPHEFVTIKEIANTAAIKEILEHKWNLHSDPDYAVRWFLFHPISFLSPYLLCLECRDQEDYAQWALKYNRDKQRDYQEIEEYDGLDGVRSHLLKEKLRSLHEEELRSIQKFRQLSQRRYDITIERMVDFFPDIVHEEELRRGDRRLDKFEEMQRRWRRSQLDENRGRRDQ